MPEVRSWTLLSSVRYIFIVKVGTVISPNKINIDNKMASNSENRSMTYVLISEWKYIANK